MSIVIPLALSLMECISQNPPSWHVDKLGRRAQNCHLKEARYPHKTLLLGATRTPRGWWPVLDMLVIWLTNRPRRLRYPDLSDVPDKGDVILNNLCDRLWPCGRSLPLGHYPSRSPLFSTHRISIPLITYQAFQSVLLRNDPDRYW